MPRVTFTLGNETETDVDDSDNDDVDDNQSNNSQAVMFFLKQNAGNVSVELEWTL